MRSEVNAVRVIFQLSSSNDKGYDSGITHQPPPAAARIARIDVESIIRGRQLFISLVEEKGQLYFILCCPCTLHLLSAYSNASAISRTPRPSSL